VAGDTVGLVADDSPYLANTLYKWDGATWNSIGSFLVPQLVDNVAYFTVPGALTGIPGLYRGRVQFTAADGTKKSVRTQFEVIDPFERPATTTADKIVERAWVKLEDLFDSELGGPWLRDKTVQSFGREKMKFLLTDALYIINNEYQPVTYFDETDWPEEHIPLAAQALLVESIYHLVRSYVEQWSANTTQVGWFDRRDYMTRWQTVLQSEEQKLMRLLDLFKTGQLGFGQTSLLVGGYSTPITRMSRFWRTRHPKYFGPYVG
jgi:hypothetical protein